MLNNEKTKTVADKLSSKIGGDYGMCNDMIRTVDTLLDTDIQVKSLIQAGLTQYQVICHLDKKTCPRCAKHDLMIYNLNDGPKPPFHKNCRCRMIPVSSDVSNSARPAKNSEGKSIKVPATMSYSEWRETYWPKPEPSDEKPISTDQQKPQRRPLSNGIDWERPNIKQAKAVDKAIPKYEDAHLYNEEELKEAQRIIIEGIMDGSQYEYVAKKLSEAIGRDFDECHDLVRTVMAQANVDSEVKSLTESGLTQYRIYAVLDKRTCTCCGQYDQKIYDLADGPKPPFHKNCRCTIGAVLSDDLRMRRAARDENDKTIQIPGIMTWSEWRTIYAFAPAVPEPDHKKL